MARLPRFVLPGQPQHVIQRGNNRQNIFAAEEDYQFYLEKLTDAAERSGCDIHAYVLMTNHVHLLVTPYCSFGVSKMMQSLGRNYVQYFNHQYKRSGTLWEGRFKSCLVESEEYLLECYRYIELNPVRAAMVNSPADYKWSSYMCNALGKYSNLSTAHDVYLVLGKDDIQRQQAYRDLFEERVDKELVDTLRIPTQKGMVIGSDRFKEELELLNGRKVDNLKMGRPLKAKKRL